MKKRYTISFSPDLDGVDDVLGKIVKMGIEIETTKRMMRTAIILADEDQALKIQDIEGITHMTETLTFRSIAA